MIDSDIFDLYKIKYFRQDSIKFMNSRIKDQIGCHSLILRNQNVWDYDLQYISQQDVIKLEILFLWNNNITYKGILHLCSCRFENLRVIQLDKNKIGNKGSKYLTRMKLNNIQEVNLCNNNIGSEGMHHLSKAQWPKIDNLLFNSNQLSVNGLRNISRNAWKSLRKLNLYKTMLHYQQCATMVLFQWNNLEYCDLGINESTQKETIIFNLTLCRQEENQKRNISQSTYPFDNQLINYFIILIINQSQQKFIQLIRQNMQQEQKPSTLKANYEMIKKISDNRQLVKDVTQFPHNIVGYVKTSFHIREDSEKQIIGCINGSGILIAPDVVLTNAHNLLPPNKNYQISYENVYFYRALHEHVGEINTVKQIYYPQKEYELQEERKVDINQYDYALLFLEPPYNQMNKININIVWEEKQLQEYCKKTTKVTTYGYPRDLDIKKMKKLKLPINGQNLIGFQYQNEGRLFESKQKSYLIEYNMMAKQGQSGSPIFLQDGKELKLIAIHKGQYILSNISYGITVWSMKEHIKQWLLKKGKNICYN